ncbi:MAG TPA: exodeoxyribonuclease VII large subunit, partial [Candidatus Thermoplasmatota archaeon]|nr:exodeoxyribonuclease VII large subunit [Candidatus Thermoplasmatota archaeon]
APADVATAISRLNADGRADVIVVGRGGGSAEDLWAFNDERVVRAVAASRIPVVSAVGHETDVTLCDLAADLRAATPSNAMEIVVPDAEALHDRIDDAETRLLDALDRLVPDLRRRVDDLSARAEDAVRRALAKEREVLGVQAARLDALSPLATLARGYAVARSGGRALRSVADAPDGADIEVIVTDGAIDATVVRTRKEAPHGQDAR